MMSSKTTTQDFDSMRSEADKTPFGQSVERSARLEERSSLDRFASRMGVMQPSGVDLSRSLENNLHDAQEDSQGAAAGDVQVRGSVDMTEAYPGGQPSHKILPQDVSAQRLLDNSVTQHRIQEHPSGMYNMHSNRNGLGNFRAYNSEPSFGRHVEALRVDHNSAPQLESHLRHSYGLGDSLGCPYGRETGMQQRLAVNSQLWDKRSEPKVNLLQYAGKVEWKVYWLQFELIARRFGWSLDQTLDRLVSSLRDAALEYYADLPYEIRSNLTTLIPAFERRFGDDKLPQVYRAKLQTLAKSSKESLKDYAARVDKTVRRAHPNLRGMAGDSYLEEMMVEKLIDGYPDSAIAYEVKTRDPKSVQDTLDLLQWHEVCRGAHGKTVGIRKLGAAAVEEESFTEASLRRCGGERPVTEDVLRQFGREFIRKYKESQSSENRSGAWTKTAECNYCHEIGHIKYDCPKIRRGSQPGSTDSSDPIKEDDE